MIAPTALGWVVEALVASAVLMLAVLVLRAPVRRAFGAQLAYALWALPVLRLLLPPLPAQWTEAAVLPIAQAGEAVAVLIVPSTAEGAVAVSVATLPWGSVLAIGWAIGAVVFFASHWWCHRGFCARVLADATPMGDVHGIHVVESAAAAGPLAFGTARRFVAFPRDFADRYEADERDLALAHEIGHHVRGDLIANWVALAVLALHWFNPVAWRAFRAFRCDQELANDARVLAGRDRRDRHAYARAIIKAAHGGAVSPACHLHTIADLKGRLKMLTNARLSRRRAFAGSTAVIALLGCGLIGTASGTQAAAAVSGRIEEAVGVQLSAPVPPAPPVPAVAPRPPEARSVKRVVVVKDGKARTYEGAEAEAYVATHDLPVPPVPPVPPVAGVAPLPPLPPLPPRAGDMTVMAPGSDGKRTVFVRRMGGPNSRIIMPNITSRVCFDGPDGPSRQFIINSEKDGKRMTVICRNRIDAAARSGAEAAMRSEEVRRRSLEGALAGIETARGTIRDNLDLTDAQRREALDGLDDAVKELREEMASRD